MVKEIVKAEVSEREALWLEFQAAYKIKNPVKFAAKELAGAFKVIPASFVGKKVVTNLPNGKGQRVQIF